MGNHNPDTYTTRQLSEHKRVHLGGVKPVKDGRVALDVSLIRWEERRIPLGYAGEPASMHWRYHPGKFGRVTLGFRHERGAIVGSLQFPDEVQSECEELLIMLSLWTSDQTPQAGTEAAPAKPASAAAGNPGRKAHRRARERLRAGEDEQAVRIDWRKDYEDETGELPDQTTSGEKQLWRNVKRGNKGNK
jgi:hypothetical protein